MAQGEEVQERTYRARQQVPVTQEQVDNDPDLDFGRRICQMGNTNLTGVI